MHAPSRILPLDGGRQAAIESGSSFTTYLKRGSMTAVNDTPVETPPATEITLESLAARIDSLGAQMTWLCENMQGLFQFITQMGQQGGGIRGLLGALKNGGPDVSTNAPIEQEVK
jgi:hypothetical protein